MKTPEASVTLSVNAGISLSYGGCRIWVDALHDNKVREFPSIDQQILEKMESDRAFCDPDVICFTHCHPDHYSRNLTKIMKERWPDAQLIIPVRDFEDQIVPTGDIFYQKIKNLDYVFFKTEHEGDENAGETHYSLIISQGSSRILIAGDSKICRETLEKIEDYLPVDAAFLNFPWVTMKRGRDLINTLIRPETIFLYHLPVEAEDPFGYRKAAERWAGRMDIPDIRILERPLQKEIF